MTKIFIHFNGYEGCALHRLFLPYREVEKQTDLFEFTFGYDEKDVTFEDRVNRIVQHDIFIFNRLLPDGLIDAVKASKPSMKIICDMDDDWRLNEEHYLYKIYKQNHTSEKIADCIKKSDYVTCTTEYLAKKLRNLNKNVFVFPNALNAEDQFESHPKHSDRIRFGFIGGSSHMKDIGMLRGVYNLLPTDVQNKVQFVLCGFDVAQYTHFNNDGTTTKTTASWEDNPWVHTEKMLTNNYQTVTDEHRRFLLMYDRFVEYDSKDAYKRVWTKSVFDYAKAYNDIDVLLVPLISNEFDASKSELKLIEASVMHKPVIVSQTMPYTICGVNVFEKGGLIHSEGNCIMIPENKGVKGWAKAITKLTRSAELRELLANNLSKLTAEGGKYNLTEVSKKRIEFLKSI